MAKPNLTMAGAAAWGDISESTEPMTANLFAVSIALPPALKAIFPTYGPLISMLASGVTLPEETLLTEEVMTKLSSYDIVVGKARGELSIKFKEQTGAPVSALFDSWHRLACDARNGGIGFPGDYKTDNLWVAALTGDGKPYYWWGFKRAFPKSRSGNPDFGNENRTPVELGIPFSYLEMMDVVEAAATAAAAGVSSIATLAAQIGV